MRKVRDVSRMMVFLIRWVRVCIIDRVMARYGFDNDQPIPLHSLQN